MRSRSCGCHSHNGLMLSPEGLAQRELGLDGVDNMTPLKHLDSKVSVSGLELERNFYENMLDSDIDEQARRFHNGS